MSTSRDQSLLHTDWFARSPLKAGEVRGAAGRRDVPAPPRLFIRESLMTNEQAVASQRHAPFNDDAYVEL